MTAKRSNSKVAEAAPVDHSFVPGKGYFRHDSLPAPLGARGGPCRPTGPAAEGSGHWLLPPNGAPRRVMFWHQDAWASHCMIDGNRIAWTPEYLGSHGWRYEAPLIPGEVAVASR